MSNPDIESIESPIYDIFDKSFEDISTDSMQYIEYYDVNLNDANAVDDYRIEVKERENWFLPCKSYIECHFKLTTPSGAAWALNENVALQNNAVGLFSRWELKFDDEIVEFVDDADIQNTVKSLVYFSDGYSDSIAKNQFWFPDTVDSSNNVDSTDIISISNVDDNKVTFFNTTSSLLTAFTIDAAGYLKPFFGNAGDVINVFYTQNGVDYPVRFIGIRTGSGIFRASSLDLTLQDSGAGEIRLAFDALTTLDSVIAIVDEIGCRVEFFSDLKPTILSVFTVTTATIDHQYFKVGGGVDTEAFSGYVSWCGIAPKISLTNTLEGINYGQRKRQKLLNNSSMVVVHIPLMNVFDLFKSMKHVTKGIKLSLRLSRNTNDRVIFADNPSIVNISKVALWIPRIKPNVSVLPSLESKLNSTKNYYTHYVDTQIFKSNLITDVANNKLFQIKIKRKRPVKCFVVFQNVDRVSGDQTHCKRIFDNVSLLKLRVVLNATTQYPEREYSTRFSASNNDYARVYNEFLRCSLKDHNIDEGSVVTFENFKTLYPIFAIDMSEQAEYNVNPESALLDVYFTTLAHTTNYHMYVLVESERKLEMVGSNGMMKYLKTL